MVSEEKIKIYRKIAYKYYNNILKDFRNIENKDLLQLKNINTSNDIKVILGILKKRSSFFKSELNEIIEMFNLDVNYVNKIIDNYSVVLYNFFEAEKDKLDKIGLGSDINIDEIEDMLKLYKEEGYFNLNLVLKYFLVESEKVLTYENGKEIYKTMINYNKVIEYYKKNINLIDYNEFINTLKEKKVILDEYYCYDNKILYYMLDEITMDNVI